MIPGRDPRGRRGRRAQGAVLCLLAASPGSVCAQTEVPDAPAEASADGAQDGGTLGIEFDVAPELVTHSPFRLRSWTSSATSASMTLRAAEPIAADWEIAFDAGPSITIAHDRDVDNESAMGASIELRARNDLAGLRPFLGYAIERSYDGVFEARGQTGHSLFAGLGLYRTRGPTAFSLELSPRWSFGSGGLEHRAVNLWGELIHPLIPDALAVQADAAIERRWHAGDSSGRRDWRFEAWVGLDAAEAMNGWVGGKAFRTFGAGVRWMRIASNRPDESSTAIAFLPAITMRVDFR